MNHDICRECETVSHCLKNGCIPIRQNLDELEDIVIRMERGQREPMFPVIDPSLIAEV
jgi:hypothetical protein